MMHRILPHALTSLMYNDREIAEKIALYIQGACENMTLDIVSFHDIVMYRMEMQKELTNLFESHT